MINLYKYFKEKTEFKGIKNKLKLYLRFVKEGLINKENKELRLSFFLPIVSSILLTSPIIALVDSLGVLGDSNLIWKELTLLPPLTILGSIIGYKFYFKELYLMTEFSLKIEMLKECKNDNYLVDFFKEIEDLENMELLESLEDDYLSRELLQSSKEFQKILNDLNLIKDCLDDKIFKGFYDEDFQSVFENIYGTERPNKETGNYTTHYIKKYIPFIKNKKEIHELKELIENHFKKYKELELFSVENSMKYLKLKDYDNLFLLKGNLEHLGEFTVSEKERNEKWRATAILKYYEVLNKIKVLEN